MGTILSQLYNCCNIYHLYKDEISRLEIKRSYIKLETEQSHSTFFNVLKNFSNNYFVCDFTKHDYFFLTEIEQISKKPCFK